MIPPSIPRFAMRVELAKKDRADGNPIPTDAPKSINSIRFVNTSLFGIVDVGTVMIAPKSIHRARPFFLARGKSHAPRKAVAVIVAKKAPYNEILVKYVRLFSGSVNREKIRVYQMRLLATIINAGANSRHSIPLGMFIRPAYLYLVY